MHITVIDDEKILTKKLSKKLRLHGYIVSEFYSFNDFLLNNPWKILSDLYIVDISLGDGSWLEIIKYLKELQKNNPNVIIMSWYTDIEHKLLWYDLGIEDYITKPFVFEELLARIKVVTKRMNQLVEYKEDIIYNDLHLKISSQVLYVKGESIYLTNKEYMLVELFLRHQKVLIDKDTLIKYVWWKQSSVDVTDNTINVTIFKLKKKLEWYFDLQTRYNSWYILE